MTLGVLAAVVDSQTVSEPEDGCRTTGLTTKSSRQRGWID